MKIIDLLNKIASGEELPKKIKYHGTIYDIERDNKEIDILSEHLASEGFYNDEIEIIEENKKIEKLNILLYSDLIDMNEDERIEVDKENRNKINEIIDYLNKDGNK